MLHSMQEAICQCMCDLLTQPHLKESTVHVENGRQISAGVCVHRCLDKNVLKADFDAWGADPNPAWLCHLEYCQPRCESNACAFA